MDGRRHAWVGLLAALTVAAGGCPDTGRSGEGVAMPQLDLSAGPAAGPWTAPRPAPAPAPTGGDWADVRGSRRWRYIVVHHSATDSGNAAQFDRIHRAPPNGFDELGYHFVIDNGRGGPDGRVEVGSRWRKQKWGAHTGGTPNNAYNEHGIGICLVGDFRDAMPTRRQLASLRRLVRYLTERYDIPPDNVIGHCDAPNAATLCPGQTFHRYLVGDFRDDLRRYAAR
ncbi:MAG: N-acetylmuramoyl-L-alanine amidase [Phycisphaerae bacterium]|nr:N-acetylmuramoyl-L-alanine amidase [Phycisphaerae bacterium]